MGERGRVFGIRAKLRFGTVAEAVQVGVFVETEQRNTAGDSLRILEAFTAVAQTVGIDIPPIGNGKGMFAPNSFVLSILKTCLSVESASSIDSRKQ